MWLLGLVRRHSLEGPRCQGLVIRDQALSFLDPDSLPEDTKRPVEQLPQRNQEGPRGPCFSKPTFCERAGEVFSRGEGWNFSFTSNLLLKDVPFSLSLMSYLLMSLLHGKMAKNSSPKGHTLKGSLCVRSLEGRVTHFLFILRKLQAPFTA